MNVKPTKPIVPIKKLKLESTPEIEKVRAAYKALRKDLKSKGVQISGIGMTKRKGVYGIKIDLADEKFANLVPVIKDSVPVHKIQIVKPPAVIAEHTYNGKTFIIETVKWQWADKVKSKDVYRDDEFVRTQTKEDAQEAMAFLLSKPKGLTYAITVFRDNEYFTYYRHSMPCLGGLVKYRDSHGEKHFMNPYFPRDIRVAFPEGDIIFIGCNRSNTKNLFDNPFYEFLFSQESPWVSAFGDKESIVFADNYFILTNMNADPTVFYSLMRQGGFAMHGYGAGKKGWNPKADILLSRCAGLQADPRRLAGQRPIRISGGTWAEGFGYTRPYNESIFKTILPHKLSQFGGLAGYPQAQQTNTYFIEEMKKVFGVDVNLQSKDMKIHDALVQAWPYFKEQSLKMQDEPDGVLEKIKKKLTKK